MTIAIRPFVATDYDAAVALWREADGVVLRAADDRAPLLAYIERNARLSFVAEDDGRIVGAVLCGTDGRRGYLQHLAVSGTHRRRSIGRRLAEHCVDALARQGIDKCHLMVLVTNTAAQAFWSRIGWAARPDVQLMSHIASGLPTA
ncbi:MAG TPA: GNAT family N-acetyltransferase [Gemmatimonadaceae bacterium]|jgi:ribosomal protein S18 acetylase RimI-like enzyme|nr:GNAT family N-acetyltransferase [Gemmatimonadaceae bacterium]